MYFTWELARCFQMLMQLTIELLTVCSLWLPEALLRLETGSRQIVTKDTAEKQDEAGGHFVCEKQHCRTLLLAWVLSSALFLLSSCQVRLLSSSFQPFISERTGYCLLDGVHPGAPGWTPSRLHRSRGFLYFKSKTSLQKTLLFSKINFFFYF